jgi:pantothenate kinase type III
VILLADCGNTSIKLALADGAGLLRHARVAPQAQAFAAFLGAEAGAVSGAVALPGSAAHAQLLARWWESAGGGRPLQRIGADLPLPDLGQYPGCGADRVLAGLAAGLRQRQSLVTVDCGTATTLGAWRVDASLVDASLSRAVRFAGGLILPGARACAAGLNRLAPALPLVEPLGPDAIAAQAETQGSIAAAIGIGYGPMVAACLCKLQRETGIRHAVLTGGGAEDLLRAQVLPRSALHPTLVLAGMHAVWRART